MRILTVLGIIGHLLRTFGFAFLAPVALALADGEYRAAADFAVALIATVGGGYLFSAGHRPVRVLRRSEAMAVVAGSWLIVGHFAAIPYVLAGLSPVDALFESISGLTTTGATILQDFTNERYGRAFFLWRAMTQWFGGLGIIALFVIILPRLGIAGRQLFFAEASDAASEPLSPQIRHTARKLWTLYVILTGLETTALIIAGMTPYEAIVHSLTTMPAGGFSPNGQSILGYHNPAAEWIIVVFMILAGASFTLQYKGFTGRPLAFFRDEEFVFYFGVTAGAALLLALIVDGATPEESLRMGFFQSASLISSTGYASVDYDRWSDAAKAVLVIVMLVGGCAGSAAGGAKSIRLLMVIKLLGAELTRALHPRAVRPVRYGGTAVPIDILRAVITLWALYLFGYLLVGTLLVLLGADLVSGFSASLACLGNIGPGFSLVGPMANFAELPMLSKLILTLAMWVGRLEVVAVLTLFHPHVLGNLQLRGKPDRDGPVRLTDTRIGR